MSVLDYQQALKRHYESGPPPNWESAFISSYATSHPWEDWAESWAHFMHMTDALETAASRGSVIEAQACRRASYGDASQPALEARSQNFDRMVEDWLSLTYVLNNLNRGLGLTDSYPFVLSAPVIDKLRFIQETIYPLE